MKPLCTSDSVAQFKGTGDPLLVYTPDGGFTNDDSILAAIDINGALAIVGQSVAIKQVKENY
jgi:hypothetical protein